MLGILKSVALRQDENMTTTLVRAVLKDVGRGTLVRFVENFLLDCNSTSVRWQAHSLVVTMMNNSPPREQEQLVDVLWELWQQLPQHGRKGAQVRKTIDLTLSADITFGGFLI